MENEKQTFLIKSLSFFFILQLYLTQIFFFILA